MMDISFKSYCRQTLLVLALGAAAGGVQAATVATPVTIKYLFDNATNTSYANPGLDSTITINPALLNFSAWSDADGTLIQASPIAAADGLQGQGGGTGGRAVAARSWHNGNAFNFSFDVAAGSRLSISQIDFWQQGSSGNNGNGPTNWTMSINGQQIGSGTATLGNPGGSRSLSFAAAPIELGGAVAFSIFATGATDGTGVASNATWRVDNFTITGIVAPVPLPGAVWLMGGALAGLAATSRRRAA
jgi:hypothetical protein